MKIGEGSILVFSKPEDRRSREDTMNLSYAINNLKTGDTDFRQFAYCICGKLAVKAQRTLEYPPVCRECWISEKYRPNRICVACGIQEADHPGHVFRKIVVDWINGNRKLKLEIMCTSCSFDYEEFVFSVDVWGLCIDFSKWMMFRKKFDHRTLESEALDLQTELVPLGKVWYDLPNSLGSKTPVRTNFGGFHYGWVNHNLVIVNASNSYCVGYAQASMVYSMFLEISRDLKRYSWTYSQQRYFGVASNKETHTPVPKGLVDVLNHIIDEADRTGVDERLYPDPKFSVCTEYKDRGRYSLVFKNRPEYL